jgi:hypothetical protein
MADAGDTVTLHNELAYADVLPVTFRSLDRAVEASLAASWADRNVRMLQACSALEEHGTDKMDEDSPHAAELQRIDQKVNLLLDMVGHLLAASQSRPAAVPVRFNTRGIVWQHSAPGPKRGTRGVVEIHLKDCLVQPLTLSGVVTDDSSDGIVQLQFDALPEPVADHMERLVFRRHRRQIAGVRSGRRT